MGVLLSHIKCLNNVLLRYENTHADACATKCVIDHAKQHTRHSIYATSNIIMQMKADCLASLLRRSTVLLQDSPQTS